MSIFMDLLEHSSPCFQGFLGLAPLQKCVGDFVLILEDFAGDFLGESIWPLFPHKNEEKKSEKSGGSKTKIPEKSVLPWTGPKFSVESMVSVKRMVARRRIFGKKQRPNCQNRLNSGTETKTASVPSCLTVLTRRERLWRGNLRAEKCPELSRPIISLFFFLCLSFSENRRPAKRTLL